MTVISGEQQGMNWLDQIQEIYIIWMLIIFTGVLRGRGFVLLGVRGSRRPAGVKIDHFSLPRKGEQMIA